ncbi:MAG TPA: alpha/beta fold hydrolase [Pseudonocardiaceae bacterium]
MLDVGDGQLMYWEDCGNPDGKPAVVLHGDPGSGCSPGARRLFNPEAYRVVLFDQRGAGRSLPHASDPKTDLSVNITDYLVADIERLREHLGIERWLVHGASWGSTWPCLRRAAPRGVTEMVIAAVTMTRRSEIQWLYHGVGRSSPPDGPGSGMVCPLPTVTATSWMPTPGCSATPTPASGSRPRGTGVTGRPRWSRWIPAVLIHGRLDLDGPILTAWELARA